MILFDSRQRPRGPEVKAGNVTTIAIEGVFYVPDAESIWFRWIQSPRVHILRYYLVRPIVC